MIVVDANVAVKWFLAEKYSDRALEILASGSRLLAPALVRIEVTSAIVRAFRNERISEAVARSAHGDWSRMLAEQLIEMRDIESIYDRAVEIAFAIKHPLADCLYVAVAEAVEAMLVTNDEPLRDRSIGLYPRIRLLSETEAHHMA